MGYSVSVKFKNSEETDRMRNFLMSNTDLLEKMQRLENLSVSSYFNNEVSIGENLSYAPKQKNLLGFHGTGIPTYIWNLCAWMSVKSNFRSRSGSIYFFYDDEKTIVTYDKENKKETVVDQDGVRLYVNLQDDNFLDKFIFSSKKNKRKQVDLLKDLNEKWNEYILEKKVNSTPMKI